MLERLEAAEMRQLSQILARFPDARRARHPSGDVLGGAELFLEREPERGEVRFEREGDRCRARDGSAMRLGEPHRIVRIVQADRHPASGHDRDHALYAILNYWAAMDSSLGDALLHD